MILEEPIHRSLHRSLLIMGGDRDFVGLTAFVAFLIAACGYSIPACLMAGVFWLFCLGWLQKLAKVDTLLCRVYLKSLPYKKLYLASGTVWGHKPLLDKQWRRKSA